MFKILYLPTAEYVNKYLPSVIDIFETYEEAEAVIKSKRVCMDDDVVQPLWLNSKPLTRRNEEKLSLLVPTYLLEVVEV